MQLVHHTFNRKCQEWQ